MSKIKFKIGVTSKTKNVMSLSRSMVKCSNLMSSTEWKGVCCIVVLLLICYLFNVRIPVLSSLIRRDDDIYSNSICPPCDNTDNEAARDVSDSDELQNIRLNWIYPRGTGFNGKIRDYSQVKQSAFVDELLEGRKHGFFVECGAENGQKYSNTIFFETQRNWTGLLIEAQKRLFDELIPRNRKAYAINACLSPSKRSGLFEWSIVKNNAALRETHVFKQAREQPPEGFMQCFAFGTLMKALNVRRVDYFSLDIEGGEIPVLKTIPWDDVYIDVIGIEYRCLDGGFQRVDKDCSYEKLKEIDDIMLTTGLYKRIAILPGGTNMTPDVERGGLDVFYRRMQWPDDGIGEN